MGKIRTKEIFEMVFSDETMPPSFKLKKNNVDKQELYDFEKEIGVDLIDMNVDQLIELIRRLTTRAETAKSIASILRKIWLWYGHKFEKEEMIFADPRLQGKGLTIELNKRNKTIKWDDVTKIIAKLHEETYKERAEYAELLILMFYCGFKTPQEIIRCQDNMIDHKQKIVHLDEKNIKLSDRCYELLVKFNGMNVFPIPNIRGKISHDFVSWHGSYFKFIINKADLQGEEMQEAANRIHSDFAKWVSNNDRRIGESTVYWLGVSDRAVAKYGTDEIKANLLSKECDVISAIRVDKRLIGMSTTAVKKEMMPYFDLK